MCLNKFVLLLAEPQNPLLDESIELDIDLGEEYEEAQASASTSEIVDLAGILGLHAMMNQVRTDHSEIKSKI